MRLSNLASLRYLFFKAKTQKQTIDGLPPLKISDLFEIVPQSSQQPLLNLKLEKKLYQKSKQLIINNKKINNYHHFQYFRGEDLIENIPYYDHYKYTEEDQINEQKDKERVAIEELMPISQHAERARLIKEKIVGYHDKQRKYQIEQFQRYLSEYPGTVKGPKPEDDWEAFRAYGLKKIPKILLDQIYEANIIKQQLNQRINGLNSQQQAQQQPEKHNIASPSSFLAYCSKDRQLLEMTSQHQGQGDDPVKDNFNNDWDQQLIQDFKTDIPIIPNMNFQNYQHFVNHWMSWINFRDFHMQHSMKFQLQKLRNLLDKIRISLDKDPQNEYIQIQANIPSLYRYYKCLPLQIQNHPGMKDIYLGLQYSSPDYSYQQKEDALNYTCKFLLPFDDISKKVLNDYTKQSRVYPTPYLLDKIFTISPQYTWDLDSFLQQIRNQELKGQISIQNKDVKLPHPPQVHKFWEEGAANLPVDYYENDDGFWDGIISQKLKRYDQHKPMLKTRRHFKH